MSASRTSSRARIAAIVTPAGDSDGKSFGRVNCRVNRANMERGVDFFGEQTLAARLGQRSVLDNVAAGADDPKRDPLYLPAVRLGQKAARLIRLRQRQGGSARAEGEQEHPTLAAQDDRAPCLRIRSRNAQKAIPPPCASPDRRIRVRPRFGMLAAG